METLVADFRYAVRSLRKTSGVTVVAVLVLTLGIGASTAIFSVVNAVLLQPLPYPEADRLVALGECDLDGAREMQSASPANYLDWKQQSTSFHSMAAYRQYYFNLSGDETPERISGAVVTQDFFQVFQVTPTLGATSVTPDPDRGRSVYLSDGLWKSRYGAAVDVLGRQIRLNGEQYTIVGVMPASFQFPESARLWATSRFAVPENPLAPAEDPSATRDHMYFDVVGRLAPDTTTDQARADLGVVAGRLAERYPDANAGRGVQLVELRESLVGDLRSTLFVLFGAVGFVLLIACANVANLLVARAASRRKEFATRAALGASPARLARQLLVESVLLALLGGGCGLALAAWAVHPLARLAPAASIGGGDPSIDWRVLAFSLVASLATGLFFGLLPALEASRADVNDLLKDTARGSTGGRRASRTRAGLVVFEIAISLVLLVGAGLMIKSLTRLQQVEPGFDSNNLLTAQIWLSASTYPEPEQKAAFFDRTLEQVRAIPGVRSAAAISRFPLTGGNSTRGIAIEGQPDADPADPNNGPIADYRAISAGYFQTMGIPVLRGREFTRDDRKNAQAVVMVNQTLVRRYFPNDDPIGKHISIDGDDQLEIVGVVDDVRHISLSAKPRAEIYTPFQQDPWPFMTIVVRSDSTAASLVASVRAAVLSVDPDQPIANVATADDLLAQATALQRFNTSLFGLFAAVALLLAAIGIYGVVSFSVARRIHEIGIRIALGAQSSDVIGLVVKQGAVLVALGITVGLVAALAVTRAIVGLLFEVSATDPTVYVAVSLVLAGTAMLASIVPTRRALKVDPMIALRYD